MPDDRQKMFSKKGTGTVPKIKYRNNTSQPAIQGDFQRNLSNNLQDLGWERYDYSRNSGRNFHQLHPNSMDTSVSQDQRQNGIHLSMPGTTNGVTFSTSSTSGSNSRRDSVGTIPKCDNVKKCPDKKQIEDKLNQIREYLQVTTSLMSSIKNNEDQENHNMDVAVSEHMQRFTQLLDIVACQQDKFNYIYNTNSGSIEMMDNVSERSGSGYQIEEKVEVTNRKVQVLREQQNALINLKRKAENQLRDAQQAQENLLAMQEQQRAANDLRKLKLECYSESQLLEKNVSETRFDATIRELEDRLRSMRNDQMQSSIGIQANGRCDNDYIQEQLENTNQVLHLLDNRDSQLNGEHIDLQQKLNELQTKKIQIDQLADQLQNLGEDDDEDIGNQVRKIVTMKQQLSSLKDLLEIVKNTEYSLLDSQNVNEVDSDSPENAQDVCVKTDNIRQDVRTHRNQNGNVGRLENNTARGNEHWFTDKDTEKDSNNSLIKIQEREKVLAELKAKKRELLEIMYKQKDRTVMNNDVCSETCFNKSELTTTNNMLDNVVMSWLPAQPNHNEILSVYSSDDCPEEDINEYSDLNSAGDVTVGNIPPPQPALSSNYSTSNFIKHRPGTEQNGSVDFMPHSSSHTYQQRVPSVSTMSAPFQCERTMSNSASENGSNKIQLQKQLELIQSVCQSLLDQQASPNVQHLRNNLTPSPMYTEPRSYMSSNRQRSCTNPAADLPYITPPMINNPQCFALGEVANNQNMLTANTLQTQAFLLNTLNQCCQMLWFQQREITSLRNMMCNWQDRMLNGHVEPDLSSVPLPPASSYIFPGRPVSSLSNLQAPSQARNMVNSKVNHVSAACSLPNLNPSIPQTNTDSAYINQNHVRSSPSARLLESSLNNAAPIHNHHNFSGEPPANNTVLSSVNVSTGINQPLPSQIWNGQALNNQVAPGNRANNYWDNFRSYSRQNLLSTASKSNEVLQNPPPLGAVIERTNVTYDHSHSFSLPTFTVPKLNLVHNESSTVPEENTPRRQLQFKTSQNLESSNKPIPAFPPDVLNINHNTSHKANERHEVVDVPQTNNVQIDISGAMGDAPIFKDHSDENQRNRNEWHDNETLDNLPKSKLFEELRDKVYKEVANLISANESRPHFLIQLFRDLQHINSDPLRGRTLQSIQTVITNSLNLLENNTGANRQAPIPHQTTADQQVSQVDAEFFAVHPTWWTHSPIPTPREDSATLELENDDPDIHRILKSIFTFLKSHNSNFLEQEQIDLLKGIIVKSTPFTQILATTNIQERTFHKHLTVVLNEALEKFKGRRIAEIRMNLLKSISDVLLGEFSFIYLVQESIPETNESLIPPANSEDILNINLPHINKPTDDGNTPQMQNGDLAEADQSRIELEEEGAVGGAVNATIVNSNISTNNTIDLVKSDTPDMSKIDFPVNAEGEVELAELGLDQVPTRLTTNLQAHSGTPTRDRSNSSRSDPTEHF